MNLDPPSTFEITFRFSTSPRLPESVSCTHISLESGRYLAQGLWKALYLRLRARDRPSRKRELPRGPRALRHLHAEPCGERAAGGIFVVAVARGVEERALEEKLVHLFKQQVEMISPNRLKRTPHEKECCQHLCQRCAGGRTRRVRLVRGEDETCPVSIGGRGGGGGGGNSVASTCVSAVRSMKPMCLGSAAQTHAVAPERSPLSCRTATDHATVATAWEENAAGGVTER